MHGTIPQRVATLFITTAALLALASSPATAALEALNCEPPENLDPLFALLDSLTQLAFLGGIGLATLGFTAAALFLMLPGQDNTRRGKLVAKNVFLGAVLLMSANMIVGFLVSQLGGVVCS